MIEQAGYPFSASRGIRFEGLPPVCATEILTPSGRLLVGEFDAGSIKVADAITPRYRMAAAVDSSGLLSFSVHTERNQVKHPDMFARRFAQMALHNFRNQGIQIMGIQEQWGPYSDNSSQFYEQYHQTGDMLQAARETWSGKLAALLGFPEVSPETLYVSKTGTVWAQFHLKA